MTLTVERLTPIGAFSRWGRQMPAWYWDLRNTRQISHHFGWAATPIDYGECPYLNGTGSKVCGLGCWEEPECITCAPSRYGWPRRPYDRYRIRRHIHNRSPLRGMR